MTNTLNTIKQKKLISNSEAKASEVMLQLLNSFSNITMTYIFNTMRILKARNIGDCYLENYIGMKAKYGEKFRDTYEILVAIGVYLAPKRILEIGTRTGISLCQLLSAHSNLSAIEKIVAVDPFDQWTSANLVRANLKYLNLNVDDKLKIHPIKSDEYFRIAEDGKFNSILIDGDHDRTVCGNDLEAAHKLCETEGIIVCDDLSSNVGECNLIGVWETWKNSHQHEYVFTEILEGKGCGIAIKL